MTDIEKLAAALKRTEPGLGQIVYNEIAERIAWCINDTSITASAMAGLIEGTHVVVPVELTGKAWDNYWDNLPAQLRRRLSIEDFRNLGDVFLKAMLKAAQE